ncbi:hypothetical protein RHRU231_470088 [Rhodococcus ruber]|uniref:Uncharacterized protein n=1 Tax=Rhodococcus ruber TaxID=1830 RepID=A0A098BLY8_9NOCA|nr:hypothetical protein RHRU231_470088 [Rhodococcus ruber]
MGRARGRGGGSARARRVGGTRRPARWEIRNDPGLEAIRASVPSGRVASLGMFHCKWKHTRPGGRVTL